MPNSTANFGLLQPLVNNATDQDLWGGYLNTTIADIDSLMLTAMNWTTSQQNSTITVAAPTAGSITTGSAKLLYICNAGGGSFAANLPAVATAAGMVVGFKKIDGSANNITITGNASDNIDGSNTFLLTLQYDYVIIQCDGGRWNIISRSADVSFNNAALTGIPTAPTAAANTSTTQVATTAFANPAATIGATGSVTLPSGIIFKWGNQALGGGGSANIVFGAAFPASCDWAGASKLNAGAFAYPVGISAISATGITVRNEDGANAQSAYWLAIGH